MPTCFSCGSTDIVHEVDASFCGQCGVVLDQGTIVSEITFGESSTGAAVAQGSFLGEHDVRAKTNGPYRSGGGESREQTLANARGRIRRIAFGLKVGQAEEDMAYRFFSLALSNHFVQGRPSDHVVAACLYVACRIGKTSHMLIDFADAMGVNVFVVGSTYLKLVKVLNLAHNTGDSGGKAFLPSIDPSIYISRFAARLHFGDETPKVAADATRLVQRFKQDWLEVGRRPAGICGACLLLAARMNNFHRSVAEIVQVVKIADVTLKKRLDEFKATPSGQLTVQDFNNLWLEESADPPAFQRARLSEKKEKHKRRGGGGGMDAKGKGKQREADDDDDDDDVDDEGEEREEDRSEQTSPSAVAKLSSSSSASVASKLPNSDSTAVPARSSQPAPGEDADASGPRPSPPDAAGAAPYPPLDQLADEVLSTEVNAFLGTEKAKQLQAELDKADERRRAQVEANVAREGPSDLGFNLDEDKELDVFLLSEEEVRIKSRVWMEFNKDWLEELAAKEAKEEMDQKNGIQKTNRPRKKPRKPRDSSTAMSSSAAESAAQMFEKKKFSKKINYNALNSLFDASFGSEEKKPVVSSSSSSSSGKKRKHRDASSAAERGGYSDWDIVDESDGYYLSDGQKMEIVEGDDEAPAAHQQKGKRRNSEAMESVAGFTEGEGQEEEADYADEYADPDVWND